jgi:hypothetical protein
VDAEYDRKRVATRVEQPRWIMSDRLSSQFLAALKYFVEHTHCTSVRGPQRDEMAPYSSRAASARRLRAAALRTADRQAIDQAPRRRHDRASRLAGEMALRDFMLPTAEVALQTKKPARASP